MAQRPGERRLYLLFEAGRTRYALEAVGVVEVARPGPGVETLHGHLKLRDLSELLGGGPEPRPQAALVLDTSPTVAVRVAEVEGVFDASASPRFPLPRRMLPLAAPALRGGLSYEGRLRFEVDTDGVARGLPRSTRRPERVRWGRSGPCLVFDSAGQRFGVPLPVVRQVVAAGGAFNAAPGVGAFVGALAFEGQLCPVFTVAEVEASEPLAVIVEVGGEVLGLSASRADAVAAAEALDGVEVLDVERMFS